MGVVLFAFSFFGVYKETKRLLFESGSILNYWRFGRGHKSRRDTYQLDIPIERLQQKCDLARLLSAAMTDHPERFMPEPDPDSKSNKAVKN